MNSLHRLRTLRMLAFAMPGLVALPAYAIETFRIAWGTGYLQDVTPAAVCAKYGDARVSYSQNNPNDFNKWVFWDSLSAPTALPTPPAGCQSIGSCSLTLQAQSGYRERVFTDVTECGTTCPPGFEWSTEAGICVPVVTPTPPETPPPPDGDICGGNPIFPLRGVKRESIDTGVELSKLPLVLSYDTTSRVPGRPPTDVDPNTGALGPNWSSSFHLRLLVQGNGWGAVVGRGDGRVSAFTGSGNGVFTPAADSQDRLSSVPGGYRYYDAERGLVADFDAAGRLATLVRREGGALVFGYSDASTPASSAPGPGYLIKVAEDTGRFVSMIYDASGRLLTLKTPNGRDIRFAYSPAGMLSSITWEDNKVRTLAYERADLPWALTGMLDEGLVRYASFGYDSLGRAQSTELGGGVNRFSANYSTPPTLSTTTQYDAAKQAMVRSQAWVAPVGAVMTNPLGTAAGLGTTTVNGKILLTSQSQPAGAGCAASSSSQRFGSDGLRRARIDFNGNQTCFAHDPARRLEVTRVEGLLSTANCDSYVGTGASLPTGSRKVSTAWHPDWSLPAVVAEPGRLTTTVYNGRPDPFNNNAIASCAPATALLPDGKPIVVVCKRVEQATTDASGSQGLAAAVDTSVPARVWTYTYNGLGRMLSSKGPRTDVNDTTTYTYYPDTVFTGVDPNAVGHTLGDLATRIDATGKATQYTKYDKAGRSIESVDPNQVVTQQTYDERQRLRSVKVGTETTQYEYYANGKLKKVTQPDGISFLLYGYDDAQRLRSVSDQQGNSVIFELDDLGNRTGERVNDPGGALKRTLGRSIDPLGRVQQLTGRE